MDIILWNYFFFYFFIYILSLNKSLIQLIIQLFIKWILVYWKEKTNTYAQVAKVDGLKKPRTKTRRQEDSTALGFQKVLVCCLLVIVVVDNAFKHHNCFIFLKKILSRFNLL